MGVLPRTSSSLCVASVSTAKLGTVSPASSSDLLNELMNDDVLELLVVLVALFRSAVNAATTSAPVSRLSSISSSETYTWTVKVIFTLLVLTSDRLVLSRRELE